MSENKITINDAMMIFLAFISAFRCCSTRENYDDVINTYLKFIDEFAKEKFDEESPEHRYQQTLIASAKSYRQAEDK